MRVLILSPEPLPLPGMPVRPLGLRAWSLAFGLKSAGIADVRIACPRKEGVALPPIPGLETYDPGHEKALLDRDSPDVVVMVAAESLLTLPCCNCLVVLDVSRPDISAHGIARLRAAIAGADLVTCATTPAAHFLMPLVMEAGFIDGSPLVIAPSVAPDLPPVTPQNGALTILILSLDGEMSGDDLAITREMADGRPGTQVNVISASDGVAFDALLGRLAKADLAITVRQNSPARAFHPSDETLLAMWAGVPVVHDEDDSLAADISAQRAGWSTDGELGRLLARILSKPDDIRRRAQRASELVRSSHTWEKTVTPLVEWLSNGPTIRERAKVVATPVPPASVVDDPPRSTRLKRGEVVAARSPLGRISYAPPMADPERATPVNLAMTIVAMALLLPIGVILLVLFALAEVVRLFLTSRRKSERTRP